MKNILALGAGRTASVLIEYLLKNSQKENWFVTVADYDYDLALQKTGSHPHAKPVQLDIHDNEKRKEAFQKADLVISYLPPDLHPIAAKECLANNAHLITASYTSAQMAAMDHDVVNKGLIFLNETGLDPGIDHMDLMKLKEKIESENGKITSVKSCCGGLIAPESDNNLWGYKFTWSPMNVVLAGQTSAKYLQDGRKKIVPYNRLFESTELIDVPGYGQFEAYPNRDSIQYLKLLGLEGVENFYRATLRKPGFANAWNLLVKLGLTDNSYTINYSSDITYEEWLSSYLPAINGKINPQILADYLGIDKESSEMQKLLWLDLLSETKIEIENASPAQILLSLLEKKWKFEEQDKDLIILQTEIEFFHEGKNKKITSTLTKKGDDQINTAMAKTGGLPAGIAAKLILKNSVNKKGVIIPVYPDIYIPLLKELEENGISFITRLSITH